MSSFTGWKSILGQPQSCNHYVRLMPNKCNSKHFNGNTWHKLWISSTSTSHTQKLTLLRVS